MRERGFFTIDAFFAVTLLLIVASSFLSLYEGQVLAARSMGSQFVAKGVGEKLAGAINTVYANGSNFKLYIDLPPKIENRDYSITFDNIGRKIKVEVPSISVTAEASVVCRNVIISSLNFSKPIEIRWDNNLVRVVNV